MKPDTTESSSTTNGRPTEIFNPAHIPAGAESSTDSLTIPPRGNEASGEFTAEDKSASDPLQPLLPSSFGRYTVSGLLGHGGFGCVYLGYDTQLKRKVAIKAPRTDRLASPDSVENFSYEARRLAQLKHPGIVTVHDVGVEGSECYIVSDYVEGTNLAAWLKGRRPSWADAARIVAAVADALAYAHSQGIVHRDVKPGNIVLTRDATPILVDFGLALSEEDVTNAPRYQTTGTPPYMSPEQARGEGHRVDGRTDVYSLGIVLYQMLCGRVPFRSDERAEVLRQVREDEPQPPRQLVPAIPRELERICLKATAKRLHDRYSTASDLAEELKNALTLLPAAGSGELKGSVASPDSAASRSAQLPGSGTRVPTSDVQPPIRVVPKGLRSFGPEDSDFFLELLPGPRDRDGLPDSIRFWKRRIETTDAEQSFATGLLYGPSGCGKSSLIRAGLLPRLAQWIVPIYVEATRDDTEARLARGLRKIFPGLGPNEPLSAMIARLRRHGDLREGRKVLIVLDQFEQWLHGHGQDLEKAELVAALRQADGEHVQVILLVRDDFWLGVSRLFDSLEVDLDAERNTRLVDLFDLRHAQRVLLLLGQAFDRLPEIRADLTAAQKNFLDHAANELSQDGRVIPVRLALFAELMKERPWTQESLIQVGGTQGVGIRFLDETFTARGAVPEHRALEKPARALLQSLLPEGGTDIKGHMRSRTELSKTCDLPENSHRFARLIEILDRDLHIITPTEAAETPVSSPASESAFYQLTHDYLVPPLRHWLTLQQRKSWRGRAALCLEEHTAQMSQWPESRYLPSLPEYLAIVMAVPRSRRRPEQRALTQAAARHYGVRWGSASLVALVLAILLQQYVSSVQATTREERAKALVSAVLSAPAQGVPYAVENLNDLQSLAVPLLRGHLRDESREFAFRLHAALALARFGEVDGEFLVHSIAQASPDECKNIVAAIGSAKRSLNPDLFQRFMSEQPIDAKTRYAIVLLHLGDSEPARLMLKLDADPSLRTAYVHGFGAWHGDLTTLVHVLAQNKDGAYQSGHCAALGLIKPDSLTRHERDALQELLVDWYRHAADGGTHSAAGWALRQWGVELPVLARGDHAPPSQHWFVNHHNITMLEIKPGTFLMGEPGAKSPDWQHEVTFTKGFYMADREVTVALYRQFLNDPDPDIERPQSWAGPGLASPSEDCPTQKVDLFDTMLFCNWLSMKEGRKACYRRMGKNEMVKDEFGKEHPYAVWECDWDANGYRLPTEAEWEYACRGKTTTAYHFGEDVAQLGKLYAVVGEFNNAPTASRIPNGWGLFDMHGNVFEWCWDRLGDYPQEPVIDPHGPESGSSRMLRGGARPGPWEACRSDMRNDIPPTTFGPNHGFRVVCEF